LRSVISCITLGTLVTYRSLSTLGTHLTYLSRQTLRTQRTWGTSYTSRSNWSYRSSGSRPHLCPRITLKTPDTLKSLRSSHS
jgi:hypothetical protein